MKREHLTFECPTWYMLFVCCFSSNFAVSALSRRRSPGIELQLVAFFSVERKWMNQISKHHLYTMGELITSWLTAFHVIYTAQKAVATQHTKRDACDYGSSTSKRRSR